MPAQSLFEQCNDSDLMAAAMLCGIEPVTSTFRNTLRDYAPLPGRPTIGDIAVAYLRAKLAEMESIQTYAHKGRQRRAQPKAETRS